MIAREMLDRFSKEGPVSVMVRGTLECILSDQRLDELFADNAKQQQPGKLMFSTVADLMGLVVLKIRPAVHAAYQIRAKEVSVSITSVYNKLNGIETAVSRALVRDTAPDMADVIDAMKDSVPRQLLPGYRTRIVDGNHLASTQRRLKELRTEGAVPLPGHTLPVLDPDRRLIVDMIPCEDGHAQERTLFPELLETVEPGDAWVGDRNFCTLHMLFAISLDRRSHFVIRHHASNVPAWEVVGRRKKVGRVENGTLYEQTIKLSSKDGRQLQLRRISIKLDQPTRHGDSEVHILTNLPKRVTSKKISDVYRQRWKIENAFQEMAVALEGEVETLGYPKAALFAFSMALISFNVLSVVKAALSSVHGVDKVEEGVSTYFLVLEVSSMWQGMHIAIPDDCWTTEFAELTPAQLARKLVRLAREVRMSTFRKHPRGPKKPPPKRKKAKLGAHVATAKLIQKRKVTA